MYTNKQRKHYIKHSKHQHTWFSTPKKAIIPGHANYVFKQKQVVSLLIRRLLTCEVPSVTGISQFLRVLQQPP